MTAIPEEWKDPDRTRFDFIIVGAGAGGAPLASRLAERGYTVLVVEMSPEKPAKPHDSVVEDTAVPLLPSEHRTGGCRRHREGSEAEQSRGAVLQRSALLRTGLISPLAKPYAPE